MSRVCVKDHTVKPARWWITFSTKTLVSSMHTEHRNKPRVTLKVNVFWNVTVYMWSDRNSPMFQRDLLPPSSEQALFYCEDRSSTFLQILANFYQNSTFLQIMVNFYQNTWHCISGNSYLHRQPLLLEPHKNPTSPVNASIIKLFHIMRYWWDL